jgi:uncharacterized protein YggU (UPF0235/DUF167 family)
MGPGWGDHGWVTEVRVPIRVRPGARRTAVGGTYRGPRGDALAVTVRARAVDGAATAAALRAVAAALGLRAASVRLVSGLTSRDKVVGIDPAPADLSVRLARLRDDRPEGHYEE